MNKLLRYSFIVIAILVSTSAISQARTAKFRTGTQHKISRSYSYKNLPAPGKKDFISPAHATHYSSEKPEHHLFDTLLEIEEEDEVNNHRKHANQKQAGFHFQSYLSVAAFTQEPLSHIQKHLAFVSSSRCIAFGIFRI